MTEPHLPAATAAPIHALRIGEVEIDLRYRRVRRPDGEVELPHRIFELLLLFVGEPGIVHTRQDLLQRVWPGLVVEDANLSQSIWAIRKAFGPARKDWIRTVSKKGYVFEPPAPIEPLPVQAVMEESESEPEPAIPGSVTPDVATSARRGSEASGEPAASPAAAPAERGWRRRAWSGAVAAAALCALAIGLGGWLLPSASALPTAVALVEVEDASAAPAARVPAALLHAWLEWKLGSLPEVTLLSQAELAARPAESVAVVLISSGPLPSDPGRLFVQARVEKAGEPRQVVHTGTPAQMASLVDRTSADVLRALTPDRALQAWPRLEVEPAAAARYVEMRRARQGRRWIEAVTLGRSLVREAPRFALARLHLAQSLATLGQLPPALEHLDAARAQLQPLPADVAAVLEAQRLGLSPDHAGAAAAYAALASRYPEQPGFSIQQARALARTGRFADARAVLTSRTGQEAWPLAIRLQWWTALARVEASLGDYTAARAAAGAAVRFAEAAGEGWRYEHGQALLALADAQNADGTGRTAALYERAAVRFEQAGDTFSALHARFAGEVSGPYRGPLRHLDAWLAQTRAAGQRQLEQWALQRAAYHYYRAGDLQRYRERLVQASAVAETMEDRLGLATLRVDAMNDAFFSGRHAQVERRLRAMLGSGVQGEPLLWARQFQALLAGDRGRYAEALAAAEAGESAANAGRSPGDPPPTLAAMFACSRGSALLSQARAVEARSAYARCTAGEGSLPLIGLIGEAEVDLLTGDRDAALRRLRTVVERLPALDIAPDRWGITVDAAALLVRAGQPDAAAGVMDGVLDRIESAGLGRTAMYAHLALAEIAMARQSTSLARWHLTQARARLFEQAWVPRLAQLDIALARAEGDRAGADRALAALDREAHRRGDTLQQLLVHSWMPPDQELPGCATADRAALVARTGFRVARLDWLHADRARVALK